MAVKSTQCPFCKSKSLAFGGLVTGLDNLFTIKMQVYCNDCLAKWNDEFSILQNKINITHRG
jgi:hypothetical protein